jgi:MFS family permease
MGPLVALGLARFAYALLLPPMRADLHWSLATAGAMNTANAAGYLAGAVVAVPLSRRTGTRQAFLAGLVIAAGSLLATAASGDTVTLAVLRLVAGTAAGVTFVTGAALVAELGSGCSPRRAAWLLGGYFAGGLSSRASRCRRCWRRPPRPAGGGAGCCWLGCPRSPWPPASRRSCPAGSPRRRPRRAGAGRPGG